MSTSVRRAPSRIIAVLAALAMVASMFALAPPAEAQEVQRFAGEDRFDTAAEVALDAFEDGADDVIVAAGFNFPDALAASGLAGLVDGPVLLVNDALDTATASTLDALEDLDPDTVHIAGGTAAVSADIEAELDAAGDWDVNRFAGADRFDTAAQMAAEFDPADVGDATAIVATGFVAADSLAAGPLSYAGPHPLLLTNQDSLPDATADALADLEVDTVLVLGGTVAVSDAVVDAIEDVTGDDSVERLAGENRFETAVEIAGELASQSNEVLLATGFGPDNVPADALAGGPYGGVNDAPLLPINDVLDNLPADIEEYLESRVDIDLITVLGGTAAVSTAVADAAEEAATSATNETISVTPDDEAELEFEDIRQYEASGLDEDATYNIALADLDNVDDDDGVITFEEDGNDADFGTLDSIIVVVNGSSADDAQIEEGVEPQADGTIEFTVEAGTEFEELVPVVFIEASDDDQLEVNDDGEPTEDFGVGGAILVLPDEAGDGAFGPVTVQFVDLDEGFFVADDARYDYESGDDFQYEGDGLSINQFEEILSVDDVLDGNSDYDGTFESIFDITTDVPGTPTNLDADANGDVDFEWDAPDPAEGLIDDYMIEVFEADDDDETDECVGTSVVGPESVDEVDDREHEVEDLADDDYCAQIHAVSATGTDGDLSDIVTFTVDADADDDAPTIEDAFADGASSPLADGDVITIEFNEDMDDTDLGDWIVRIVDDEDEQFDIDCAGGDVACTLIDADETLEITLTIDPGGLGDPATDSDGISKTGGDAGTDNANDIDLNAEITDFSSNVTDGSGNEVDLDESDDTTIDIPIS